MPLMFRVGIHSYQKEAPGEGIEVAMRITPVLDPKEGCVNFFNKFGMDGTWVAEKIRY